MPDLNSKSKWRILANNDSGSGRVKIFQYLSRSGDGREIKGVEYHAGKAYQNGDNYS